MKKLLTRNKLINMHNNISGDVSCISGDLDKCEITDEERANGININDLIGK